MNPMLLAALALAGGAVLARAHGEAGGVPAAAGKVPAERGAQALLRVLPDGNHGDNTRHFMSWDGRHE